MAKAKLETKEVKFSKEQILKSKKYENERDVINALLKEDKKYSFSDIDKLINDFMKGKVR